MPYDIKADLYNYRPNASPNSINQYASTLNKLYKYIWNDPMTSLDWVCDPEIVEKVMGFLELYASPTKRNYLNAIIVAQKGVGGADQALIETYEALRDQYHDEYLATQKTLTPKQETNWVPWSSILQVVEAYKKTYTDLEPEGPAAFKILSELVLLLLYTEMPPIRNDYGNVKLISRENYKVLPTSAKAGLNMLVMTGEEPSYFVLNEYKTSKTFGEVEIAIPPSVKKWIKLWLMYNETGWLLIGGRNKTTPLGSNGITIKLRAIFKKHLGKNISTNMLRHIYVSERYGTTLAAMNEDAVAMLHDQKTQQKVYIKNVDSK